MKTNATQAPTRGWTDYLPTLGWGAKTNAAKTDAAKTDAEDATPRPTQTAATGRSWMPWNWGTKAARTTPVNGETANEKTANEKTAGQKTAEAPSSNEEKTGPKTGDTKLTKPSLFYERSGWNPQSLWRSKWVNPDHKVSIYYPDAWKEVEDIETKFKSGSIGMATAVGRLSKYRTFTAMNSDEVSWELESTDWAELICRTVWPYANDNERKEFGQTDGETYRAIIANIIEDDTKKTGPYSIRDINWAYQTKATLDREKTMASIYSLPRVLKDLQTVMKAVKALQTRLDGVESRCNDNRTSLTELETRYDNSMATTPGQSTVAESILPTTGDTKTLA